MTNNPIEKAFILAAGLGTRMRPITFNTPKPMIKVAGQPLLERTLDQLVDANIKDVVINTHHLPQQVRTVMNARFPLSITFSHEQVLLDTAGGIKKMLQHFGEDPFYVLSGDGLWTDKPGEGALKRLAAEWDPNIMDILILLQRVDTMKLTKGVGDYDIKGGARAVRSKGKNGTHMFTSMRINHPRIFANLTDAPSSYLPLLDQAERQGRLFAIEHTGDWHHISTPEDLDAVNAAFKTGESAA
jgi:MurNAc alpha-1-phosphate uridylyltransferase